ncbi:serine-aspartate repeat-containing protein F-like [Leptidea sinapis]|uniref:serine-aspartate repeat-containing protein F-like n=1 Tax=Leptidea sinapis TaxID=189913 RepID=UPI0021C3BC36|nr:serine-aspartate repeat-containing protein F-like [Leptidea sinapis]
MRAAVISRNPELREKPWRRPPRVSCPRRICIPIEPGNEFQNLDVLHDLANEDGANEMNALLSLVISMGHNRVAGALRFGRRRGRPVSDDDSGTSHHGDEAADESSVDSDTDRDADDDDLDTDTSTKKPQRHSDTEYEHLKSAFRAHDPDLGTKDDRETTRSVKVSTDTTASRSEVEQDEKPSTSKNSKTDIKHDSDGDDEADEDVDDSDDDGGDRILRPQRQAEYEIFIPNDRGEDCDVMQVENVSPTDERGGRGGSRAKRQKLDSGLGDPPPADTQSQSEDDEPPSETTEGRRRSSISTSRLFSHRQERQRALQAGVEDSRARRLRLCRLMRRATRELPLPPPLRNYVNLGRCYSF